MMEPQASRVTTSLITLGHDLVLGAIGTFPSPAQPLTLMIPGLTASKNLFYDAIASSSLRRYSPIAIDTVGVGDSSHPDPDKFSYSVASQGELVGAIIRSIPNSGVNIVSHSWGEALALSAIQEFDLKVNKFVSVSGSISGYPNIDLGSVINEESIAAIANVFKDWGMPQEYVLKVAEVTMRSASEACAGLKEVFHRLDAKKYLVRGQEDTECLGIGGFDEIISISDAGHNPPSENPRDFLSALTSVLY